ncbi:MAG: gliding motility-associated C-terminal domain-containing protein [Burkholderiales bacterium]|nr:gliding motility-associated C-terminal domain-containing protein [Bacteroidia bacterium]
MKKSILLSFTVLSFIFNFLLNNKIQAQTATTTIFYSGFQGCGGCTVCGADYYCFNTLSSYCGNTAPCGTKSFVDPVPAGNIVTSVNVGYFSADCSGGTLTADINGQSVPTVNEGNTGCLCSNAPCAQSATSSNTFPCGLPGYNNGGVNNLQLCTGANVCINRLVLTLTYAPANQASPATQPGAISGLNTFCPGVAQVFSIPAVSNASSYVWSVPAGWTINSGQGSTSINATPGSAGNICVYASNLCGNSASTCLSTVLNTTSSAPTSVSSSVSSVCGSGTTNLTVNGGSLGTGANWNWYAGGCGGAVIGSGTSISVSASSTTTYFVNAVGSCNTTACASVQFVVNPIPTANAGATAVLTCANTTAVLSGSGGGSYSWTGPGIVSNGNTANPTINQPGTYNLIVTSSGCSSPVSSVNITQDIVSPIVTSNASGILNCTLTSVNVNANTSSSPVSFSWSGAGITSGGTSVSAAVNQPGTYNYIVTNTSNGCTASGSQVVTQNISNPVVASSASGVLNCTLTSVNVNATTTTNPVNYNWSGTGITSLTNISTINVNQGGTFNYTVTDTSTGCFAVGSQVVTQDIATPGVTPSVSGQLTCTNLTVDVASSSSASPISYNWSGTGITAGSSTGTITVNQTGSFNYTVTNTSNGCITIGSQAVNQNTTVPTVTMPATQTITCSAPSVTLNASASPSNCNPIWTGGVTSGASSFTAVVSSPGFYTLTATDPANGCFVSGITQVVPSAGFPTVTTSATNSITCTTSTAQVVATTTSTPISYSWAGPGITSGAATATANVNASGQYTVIVQNTSSLCSSTITVDVALNNTAPSVSLTTSATNGGSVTCTNTMVPVTPTVSPIGSPFTYTWSASTGTITNQANTTFTAAGIYTLEVTNTLTGCVATTTNSANTFTVFSNQVYPIVTLTATSTNSIIGCLASNSVVTLSCSVTNTNTSIMWLPNGVTTSTLNATSAGIYTVVVIDAVNGCSVAPQYTVGGGTPPQNVDAGAFGAIPCGSPTLSLNGTTSSTDAVTYSWSGPNSGSILSGSNTANPAVMDPGVYSLTITNSLGCSATATINVTQGNVIAAFTANPTSGLSPLEVNFTDASSGATGYSWNFGDAGTSILQNPSHTFTTGTYTVILTVTSGPCMDTSSAVITVEDGLTLVIPNVFTPNNDGSNDIFTIKSTGVKEISLQVFSRWGQKLYEFAGPKASWDGLTPQGGQVPEGTYFYFVKASGFDDTKIEKNGTVNLFR